MSSQKKDDGVSTQAVSCTVTESCICVCMLILAWPSVLVRFLVESRSGLVIIGSGSRWYNESNTELMTPSCIRVVLLTGQAAGRLENGLQSRLRALTNLA
jgi:hypothetical protein